MLIKPENRATARGEGTGEARERSAVESDMSYRLISDIMYRRLRIERERKMLDLGEVKHNDAYTTPFEKKTKHNVLKTFVLELFWV